MRDLEKIIELIHEKIKLMIDVHHRQTGNKPHCLSLPFPEVEVSGVKITFYNGGHCAITADEKNVFYHYESAVSE